MESKTGRKEGSEGKMKKKEKEKKKKEGRKPAKGRG